MDILSIISNVYSSIKAVFAIAKKIKIDRDFENAINKDLDGMIKEYYSVIDFNYLFSIEDFFENFTEQILNGVDVSKTVDDILLTMIVDDDKKNDVKEFLNKLGEMIIRNYLICYPDKNTKAMLNVILSNINKETATAEEKEVISKVLTKFFNNGDYEIVRSSLSVLRKHNGLKDLYWKYLIRYSCVCEESVDYCVGCYIDIMGNSNIDDVLWTLISHNKIETLKKYKDHFPEKYINIVDSLNNNDIDYGFALINSIDDENIKNSLIMCLFNKVVFSDPKKICGFAFENINELPFHLKVLLDSIPAINSLREGTIYIKNNVEVLLPNKDIDKMNVSYKELYYSSKIYKCCSKSEMEDVIKQIDKNVINTKYVKASIIQKEMFFKDDVDIGDVIDSSNSLNCGKLLLLYLTTYKEIDEAYNFLKTNQYLLLKYIHLYVMYLKILIQTNKIEELKEFLDENEKLCEDINFKIASLCVCNNKTRLDEIESLIKNSNNYESMDIILLIIVANYTNQVELVYKLEWEKFILNQDLSEYVMHLLFANKNYDKKFLLSLCDKLISFNPNSYVLLTFSGMLSEMLNDYFDALDKYEASFRINKNIGSAIRWLNCSLIHKGDYEENDIVEYCASSNNADAQLLVSDFYLSKNDVEKSITHLTNSYLLGCTNLKGIGSIAFRIATFHSTSINNKKSSVPNTCVYLSNQENNKEIKVCIYKRNNLTKDVIGFEKDGMFHHFEDEKEIRHILYSKKKEKVSFNGGSYIVSKITSIVEPFHHIGIDLLVKSGDMIAFSSEDPKESAIKLINYIKENNQSRRRNEKTCLMLMGKAPLETIAKNIGKLYMEMIVLVQHRYDTYLFLNDAQVKEKYDRLIISFDACVLLSQLNIDLSSLKEKAIVPYTVKNKILKECRDLLNEIEIDNDTGVLFVDKENKVGYHKTSSEDKRNRREFIDKIKDIIGSFDCEEKENKLDNEEFIQALKGVGDVCSSDTVATALKYNAPLLTDDIFLARMAICNKAKTFGMTQCIFDLTTEINDVKNLLIRLTELNYYPVINSVFFDFVLTKTTYSSAIRLIDEILSYNYSVKEIDERISKQKEALFKINKFD